MTPSSSENDLHLSESVAVAAFYKFVDIDATDNLREDALALLDTHGIKGTMLIATEGINATISGTDDAIAQVIAALRSDARFSDLEVKFSRAPRQPFRRLKVKVKREIVTLDAPEARPSAATGRFVAPADWNALISQPDVLLIDTRNDYEVQIGTFEGAQNPKTRSFGEFRDYVANELAQNPQRKIAMFCTGGIRCEKASAYLITKGFTDVNQLGGGILKYLEDIAPDESLWRGECFVFDERVALGQGLQQGNHTLCASCGVPMPLGPDTPEASLRCDQCAEDRASSSCGN